MDTFVDERDYSLLERDRYTFFVLRRIIGGSCRTLLSNHENLMICYTDEPYPVWIWTVDGAPIEIMEKAYRLVVENGFVNNGQRLNMKYDLAEYMIRRAAEEGKELYISTNMFAYDCREPVAPSVKADGNIHRCTAEDLDELTEFLDVFHQEIGIDRKDAAGYRADAQEFIDSGNMFLWKNAQGVSVASCKYASNGMMASINLVFTKKAYRRKHYAENLVYQVTTIAKEAVFIQLQMPVMKRSVKFCAVNCAQ